MMELDGGHRNFIMERRNPIEFELLFTKLTWSLNMILPCLLFVWSLEIFYFFRRLQLQRPRPQWLQRFLNRFPWQPGFQATVNRIRTSRLPLS